ncbi:LexA family transcriptional regulator [Aurantiacibacter xanthus]|uniref:LexA family transcriptional regulator n=1 Tax=Aurantiacibacter xanthus TaxID=1784712 RepID=A0A3A1PCE9_9SPHN|nr:LexA family transcriptional regulator [Aurantiacibacter xanthus]RIV91482.1 LexA family transcriptional regulator [Aurantiacibacter xanthus]
MEARRRLAEVARERGSSLAALSRMLGRNPTYLQQYITKGSPRKLEEEDRRKLAQFLGIAESELGAPSELVSQRVGDWVELSRLNIDASAGPGALHHTEESFDAFHFSRRWLAENGLEGAKLSAIRVIGDSMEPLLREGDEVLVDMRDQPFRDGIYVVRLDDTLLVKRVASQGGGRFSLLSQNLAYPPISVDAEDFAIIGRVVWKSGRV